MTDSLEFIEQTVSELDALNCGIIEQAPEPDIDRPPTSFISLWTHPAYSKPSEFTEYELGTDFEGTSLVTVALEPVLRTLEYGKPEPDDVPPPRFTDDPMSWQSILQALIAGLVGSGTSVRFDRPAFCATMLMRVRKLGDLDRDSCYRITKAGKPIGDIRITISGTFRHTGRWRTMFSDHGTGIDSMSDVHDEPQLDQCHGFGTLKRLRNWICLSLNTLRDDDIRYREVKTVLDSDRVTDFWAEISAPPFPMDALPSVIRRFVEDRSDVMGASQSALAWATLGACSAAIHGMTRLTMKQHDDWQVPAALWVAVVGDPSSMKSPIIDAALKPLATIQNADAREWQTKMEAWESVPEKDRKSTPEPRMRRLLVNSATSEALQLILAKQNRGVMVHRDELAGWIADFDRYSGGKSGGGDRAFHLQCYNGGPYSADRISRKFAYAENLLTAVLGGIQPDRLKSFGDLTDDGLMQRMIFTIAESGAKGTDKPGDRSAVAKYAALIESLVATPHGLYRLPKLGMKVREMVEDEARDLARVSPISKAFGTFAGKLPGLFGRLALVLHMIEVSPADPFASNEISIDAAEKAAELIFKSVIPSAAKVYENMSGGYAAEMRPVQEIAGFILAKRKDRVLVSDVTSNVWSFRGKSVRDVQKAMSVLDASKWVTPDPKGSITDPRAWIVNGFIHHQFVEKAKAEMEMRARARELILQAANSKPNSNSNGDE